MSFQQGGGLGRRRGSAGAGWWLRRRGVAPDAHTPTPTNYHCVTGNKEEVKTEADESVCPFYSRECLNRKEDGTGDVLPLSQQLCPPCLWRHSKRHLVLVWAQLYKVR